MNRAASLTVIAVGAIFAFAITASPTFLNLQVAGWILMFTGACGLLLARGSRDWLRRTVIMKGSPDISDIHRSNQRRRAEIASSEQAHRPAPAGDQPTQPIARETIEEYLEP